MGQNPGGTDRLRTEIPIAEIAEKTLRTRAIVRHGCTSPNCLLFFSVFDCAISAVSAVRWV
jgi:hypothetical protein